ncbi:MAG: hypothetical protein CSA66_05340 [Proteobacteria bacterium]|nr:MAG: hypothetical protein CSA66_05340 [Pseudomonadota bacterium]
MGLMRTLYREIRDILGMAPPPENDTQRAERVCGELKSELGGKRSQDGDDYILTTQIDGRPVRILFEASPGRAALEVGASASQDVAWEVVADAQQGPTAVPRGFERVYVTSGIYVEGPSNDHVLQQQSLWQRLPTGARGVATQLLQKTFGKLEYSDGSVTLTPEVETIAGKSARYTVKSQLQSLLKVAEGIDQAWG